MQPSTTSSIQPRLLEMLALCRTTEAAFIAQVSEAERMAFGTPERWAVKDHLVHLTFWRHHAVEHLTAVANGETPAIIEEFQPVNEQVFERERLTLWNEVLTKTNHGHDELIAAVRNVTEADLTDPNHHPWSPEIAEPLWWVVTGSGFEHPHEHYAALLVERDDLASATKLLRSSVDALSGWFPESERSAMAVYNLGCFYAKTGQRAAAVEAVRDSLARVPQLVEWSKHDSDLDLLRDDPTFQAIYAS